MKQQEKSMPLQVVCPNPKCQKPMMVKDELVGQALRCPACKATLAAPSRSDAPAAPKLAKDPSTIQSISSAMKSTLAAHPARPSAPSESACWGVPTMDAASAPPVLPSAPPTSAGAASRKPARGNQREELPASIGPYQVSRELGRGAFGVVYKGHDPKLKRDVAIKVLNHNALHSTTAVERFLREAQVVAQMHHNHIVPVYELGEHEECHYIASRFVPGKTLSDLIPDEGMAAVKAVGLVLQLLEALTYAHKMNVLHRDVKPANAIVDAEGQLYLMDFGLAGWVGQTDGRATQDGTVMGTPSYMPPEQARGDINNIRETADQYSAGVVLYELLTGHVPFEGGSMVVLLHNVISTPPSRPSEFRADLDPQLEEICLKTLAKRAEDRYANCQALADALRCWLDRKPILTQNTSVADRAGPRTANSGGQVEPNKGTPFGGLMEAPALVSLPRKGKRTPEAGKPGSPWWKRPRVLAAAGVAVVVLVGLVGLGLWASGLIRIQSTEGDYVIDTDDPDFAFSVSKGRVILEDRKSKRKYNLQVVGGNKAASEYELEVTDVDADLSFKTKNFTIRRGEQVALKTWFERKESAVAKPPPTVGITDPRLSPTPKDRPLGMKFVPLAKGTFYMGWDDVGKRQGRKTEIKEAFEIAVHTVTQAQWQAVMGNNPSDFSRDGERKDKVKDVNAVDLKQFPVEQVSWNDVQEFIKRLNEQNRDGGYLYRLPTEAEWEYACRGGAPSEEECSYHFYFAKATNDLSSEKANFNGDHPFGNAPEGPNLGRPTKIGSYQPNVLGLYDMQGNVWQWCQDFYGEGDSARVVRGGSWVFGGSSCRAANRDGLLQAYCLNNVGFRLARVPAR
jgi:serine/threonine protein kinase/formylglycine-generating enzyme required for sulfatase activity